MLLLKATVNPVPFGVDALTIILFLSVRLAVVDAVEVATEIPEVPKLVPLDVAFR